MLILRSLNLENYFMVIDISTDAAELGKKAAAFSGMILRETIKQNGEARLLLSTGSSQFETLSALLNEKVEWRKIEIFHLDEYIGLPSTHKASFRKYLNDRFISKINAKKFYGVDTEGNPEDCIARLSSEIRKKQVDLALIGIGVNGHIAFNDPPADFDTRESFRVVKLDDTCRRQQVDEGWFEKVDEVPQQAVSMTPWQIMQSKTIVSCVPHKVKARAVKDTLSNTTTRLIPATLLKEHSDFHLFIDTASASEIIHL